MKLHLDSSESLVACLTGEGGSLACNCQHRNMQAIWETALPFCHVSGCLRSRAVPSAAVDDLTDLLADRLSGNWVFA